VRKEKIDGKEPARGHQRKLRAVEDTTVKSQRRGKDNRKEIGINRRGNKPLKSAYLLAGSEMIGGIDPRPQQKKEQKSLKPLKERRSTCTKKEKMATKLKDLANTPKKDYE